MAKYVSNNYIPLEPIPFLFFDVRSLMAEILQAVD